MNPISIVKSIISKLPDLKDGSKWQASHTVEGIPTTQRPHVEAFDCGAKDGEVWFRYQFVEDGANKDLRGTYSLTNTKELITIDSIDVDADDVIISNRTSGPRLRGVVEFEYRLEGVTHRYRFDATLVSLF